MAVGIRLKFDGGTQENYDAAHGVMEIDTDPPQGMVVHSAGPVDGGWGVIDFWESRAKFDAFFGSRVKAAVDATGVEMTGAPDVKEFPVHEIVRP
jgi:hypothetical protein